MEKASHVVAEVFALNLYAHAKMTTSVQPAKWVEPSLLFQLAKYRLKMDRLLNSTRT